MKFMNNQLTKLHVQQQTNTNEILDQMLIQLKQKIKEQNNQPLITEKIKTLIKFAYKICSVKVVEQHKKYLSEFIEVKKQFQFNQDNLEIYVKFMMNKFVLFKKVEQFYISAVQMMGYRNYFHKNFHFFQQILTQISTRYNKYLISQYNLINVLQ